MGLLIPIFVLLAIGGAAVGMYVAVGMDEGPAPQQARKPRRKREPKPPPTQPPKPKTQGTAALDKLLVGADESMARARMLFDEARAIESVPHYSRAEQAAKKAKNTYGVLVDAYTGIDHLDVVEKLDRADQLLRLITAEKERLAGPSPGPSPTAKPAARPTPSPRRPVVQGPSRRPDPTPDEPEEDLPRSLQMLKEYVSSPNYSKVNDARYAAAEERRDPEFGPLIQAAGVFFETQKSAEPFNSSTERKEMVALLKKHDPARFVQLEDKEIGRVLEAVRESIGRLPTSEEGGLLKLWGIAYLSRYIEVDGAAHMLSRWLPILGLGARSIGAERFYGTPEGLVVERLKSAVDFKEAEKIAHSSKISLKHPVGAATVLMRLVKWRDLGDEAEMRESVEEMIKLLGKAKPRARDTGLFRHVQTTLKESRPCKSCTGSGKKACAKCREGQATFMCERCSGYGKILGSGAKPADCPDCKAKGKWKDDCPHCKASGFKECNRCKGAVWTPPEIADLVGFTECGTCDGGGFLFLPLRIPCSECDGIGQRPYKPD